MSNVSKYVRPELNNEVKFWINHNLSNYLKKNPENYQEVEHIVDFLNSDEAPKRLRKMSYQEAKQGAERWVSKLIKQSEKVSETEEDVKVILNFENGFKLVQLLGENAFKREGNLMRHCVGSYYGGETKVYSLRDYKNMPHCTMEVDQDIQQIKGKGNGSIHPKYIDMVLQSLEYFGLDVNEHDMPNLGYIPLSDDTWKVLDGKLGGVKYLTWNNKQFFYANQ